MGPFEVIKQAGIRRPMIGRQNGSALCFSRGCHVLGAMLIFNETPSYYQKNPYLSRC